MKAVQITQYGGPEVLEYTDVADPVAGPGEAVLQLAASGINYMGRLRANGPVRHGRVACDPRRRGRGNSHLRWAGCHDARGRRCRGVHGRIQIIRGKGSGSRVAID